MLFRFQFEHEIRWKSSSIPPDLLKKLMDNPDVCIVGECEVKDMTDAKVQAAFTDEKAFKAIKEGIKDGDKTRMKPAEDMSDDDIKALVAYVRAFKK